MVKIRLTKTGRKNQPCFRVVAMDSAKRRDGRPLAYLGHYLPYLEPKQYILDEAAIIEWLKLGAQPSDAALKLMRMDGVWAKWLMLSEGKDIEGVVIEKKVFGSKSKRKSKKQIAKDKVAKEEAAKAKADAKAAAEAPKEEAAEAKAE